MPCVRSPGGRAEPPVDRTGRAKHAEDLTPVVGIFVTSSKGGEWLGAEVATVAGNLPKNAPDVVAG